MVKLEDDLAKLVTEREKLMAMKRKAELTFEKQQTVETFRPTWCGPKVETLPYCEEKLNGLDDRIISLRQEHDKERSKDPTARTSHCGFVTFRGRRFAEMAQNLQISADKREWKVSAAPEVNDLRWADLQKPRTKKIASEALGFICCIGLYLAFMPLVGFITNLGKVVNVGPLQPIWDGFAPTLGLTVCLCFLPTVFMTIFNTFFVLKSDSFAQHKLQFWFFLFQLIFVVLVTTLGKSILTRFPEIAQNPQDMLEIMADSLPNASHYYMTYLVLQWSRRAMEMLRYMPLSKFLLFRAIFSPEEAKEMAEPEDQDSFGFGARNVNLAVSVVLGLVFCSMSPIVTLLAMCDLILARMTYGYLTIFAETKKPDLGGVFWVTQIQFIQVAMALYCLFMVGVLRQKSSSYAWVVAAPSLLIVLFSFWHIPRAYQWRKLPFQEAYCTDSAPVSLLKGDIVEAYRRMKQQQLYRAEEHQRQKLLEKQRTLLRMFLKKHDFDQYDVNATGAPKTMQILLLLLKFGADPTSKDSNGKTAYSYITSPTLRLRMQMLHHQICCDGPSSL
eukprot:symbB.v1.2.012780.t1/scaffold859.1/size157342/5